MYRLVMFACAVAVGVWGGSGMNACGRVAYVQCCKKDIIAAKDLSVKIEGIEECFKLKKKSPSCDMELCLAKIQGIILEDGTINQKKLAEDIEQKFEAHPELVDVLKVNCIFGDFSSYGPPDICDLKKQRLCFDVQIIKSCDEWKEDGVCSTVKDMAEKCLKSVS